MDAFAQGLLELLKDWGADEAWLPDAGTTGLILKAVFALVIVLVIMGCCLYTVLLERKTAAWAQGRVGPSLTTFPLVAAIPVLGRVLTYCGFIQPLADGGKLFMRQEPLPEHVNKFYYCLAPCLALAPALITMVMIPYSAYVDPETGETTALMLSDMSPGFVFMFAVSSLGVYGPVIGGWASNSKYPFLGSIRGSAQLISYELSLVLSILPVVLITAGTAENPLSLLSIVEGQSTWWNVILAPLSAAIYFVALLAEMNRQPFDMPESETDTVGGFHTEYGTFKFGLFYTGEYLHMILGSILFTLFFLGGWNALPFLPPSFGLDGVPGALLGIVCLAVKVLCVLFVIIWIRWTVPRFRFDQVMRVGWKLLLPFAIANAVAYFVFFAVYETLLR